MPPESAEQPAAFVDRVRLALAAGHVESGTPQETSMQVQLERPSAPIRVAAVISAPVAAPMPALMWLNADRVLYVGLLGVPSVRTFGAYSVYLSLNTPHRISIDGDAWQSAELSIVPPRVPHRIVSGERMIASLLIESETVLAAELPAFLRDGRGAIEMPCVLRGMREALAAFRHTATQQHANPRHAGEPCATTADFDRLFFGESLLPPPRDSRIGTVLARIKLDPTQAHSAQECAAAIHVSVSRFLHLFKAEVGVPFRSFRTWQRARSVLYYVTRTTNLAHIALDVGYPDSTHFSHSIRQVFGLTPKSIFAGCRKLALYGSPVS
jgi:AraC-like DNA-binding protein